MDKNEREWEHVQKRKFILYFFLFYWELLCGFADIFALNQRDYWLIEWDLCHAIDTAVEGTCSIFNQRTKR